MMQFGPLQIPVAGLKWLAIAPECRGRGFGSHLLAAAEKQALQDGAVVGLLRTTIPRFFRRTGWRSAGSRVRASPAHAVLARLLEEGMRHPSRQLHRRLHIRPWRRWEEGALVRIYRQNLPGMYGPTDRTLAYWQWLLRRHAYDDIYVALDGPDLWDLKEARTPIVGYAVLKRHRLLEIDDRAGAAEGGGRVVGPCLRRRDRVRLPQRRAPRRRTAFGTIFFVPFGGRRRGLEPEGGEVCMAQDLDPTLLLQRLCGEFCRRARRARLERPVELGILVEGQKHQIELSEHGAAVAPQRLGRSYLQLNVADFTRLALGQLDWDRATAEKRLQASTSLAQRVGRALFPRLPLWHPPLDEITM